MPVIVSRHSLHVIIPQLEHKVIDGFPQMWQIPAIRIRFPHALSSPMVVSLSAYALCLWIDS